MELPITSILDNSFLPEILETTVFYCSYEAYLTEVTTMSSEIIVSLLESHDHIGSCCI
jgi:hypothetical protein